MATTPFVFARFSELRCEDVRVRVAECRPADPARGYVPAYETEIIRMADDQIVGHLSLRIGDTPYVRTYGGHIGYGILEPYRGHHFAAKGCRAIIPIAQHHGVNPLWLTVEPHNTASRRTCERIGAEFVEIVALPADCDMYLEGQRHKCRYRWDLGAVSSTP
ncbi:MAG: GNAT family N-acetyltransferase [Myxococcota bacterium]